MKHNLGEVIAGRMKREEAAQDNWRQDVFCKTSWKQSTMQTSKHFTKHSHVRTDLDSGPGTVWTDYLWVSMIRDQCQNNPEVGQTDGESYLKTPLLNRFQVSLIHTWVRSPVTRNPECRSILTRNFIYGAEGNAVWDKNKLRRTSYNFIRSIIVSCSDDVLHFNTPNY